MHLDYGSRLYKHIDTVFQELTESVPAAIFQYVIHTDGTESLNYISKGCETIWGLTTDELQNDPAPLWDMIVPEDIEGMKTSIEKSMKDLTFWEHQWRIRLTTGEVKWLSGIGRPTLAENGDYYWNSVVQNITQKRVDQYILDSFFEQRLAMNSIVALDGEFLRVNHYWEDVLGYTSQELEGRYFIEFVHPDDVEMTQAEAARVTSEGIGTVNFENRYRHKDGSYRTLSWYSNVFMEKELIYAVAVDITESKESTRKLQQASTILRSTSEGVMLTDLGGQVLDVNDAFEKITGFSQTQSIGRIATFLQSEKHPESFFDGMWEKVHTEGFWRGEVWCKRSDGSDFPTLVTINTINEGTEKIGYVSIFSDISTLKAQQEELRYIANHGSLTSLPNRRLLTENLKNILDSKSLDAVKAANAQIGLDNRLAIILIDIDQFKYINDSMGHQAGDALLKEVAMRINHHVKSNDILARVSGDEFIIVTDRFDSDEALQELVMCFLAIFNQEFVMNHREISLTASIGISVYPDHGKHPDILLANADAAMYEAKARGRNTYALYSKDFTEKANEYVFLENALRKALSENQLFLTYQPQFCIENKTLRGMEALIRWEHPERGMISPSHFIPLAEQTGLINEIGRWVLQTACRQAKQWLESGFGIGKVSVNVAAIQFNSESFFTDLDDILEQTGLPPKYLELELTESFIMHQPDIAICKLSKLRDRGISIAVDDFGTGYSSLSYLKKLPIDYLKIDRSFIQDIPQDEDDKAITEAIIGLSHSLNLKIIAEGVETAEQAAFLKSKGCVMQGFLFSKPLIVDDMEKLFKNGFSAIPFDA